MVVRVNLGTSTRVVRSRLRILTIGGLLCVLTSSVSHQCERCQNRHRSSLLLLQGDGTVSKGAELWRFDLCFELE